MAELDVEEADKAVREAILLYTDPHALKDDKKIRRLESEIEQETEPVKRVKKRAQLEKENHIDDKDIERRFVKYAKRWTKHYNVSVDSLRTEGGIPPRLLKRAGLSVRGAGPDKRTSYTGKGTKRVTQADVVKWLNKATTGSYFTLHDLQQHTGCSAGTARSALGALGDRIVSEGPDPNHTGPGRAPNVFRVVGDE